MGTGKRFNFKLAEIRNKWIVLILVFLTKTKRLREYVTRDIGFDTVKIFGKIINVYWVNGDHTLEWMFEDSGLYQELRKSYRVCSETIPYALHHNKPVTLLDYVKYTDRKSLHQARRSAKHIAGRYSSYEGDMVFYFIVGTLRPHQIDYFKYLVRVNEDSDDYNSNLNYELSEAVTNIQQFVESRSFLHNQMIKPYLIR